jgi:ubiquinone/menaquinone biosynthesis C-methylase UbiE
MKNERKTFAASKFYGRVGTHGWRGSDYFTFSASSSTVRRWIASQLPAARRKILSIGCGAGEMENHLIGLGHFVVGLDLSGQMLRRASRRGVGPLVQADARALPFRSGCFDFVMFLESIGHLQLKAVFEEARRVLRKRGQLLITTYPAHIKTHACYRKFAVDEITGPLVDVGFRIKKHRMLDAKRNPVTEVPSIGQSTLLYISSTKQD